MGCFGSKEQVQERGVAPAAAPSKIKNKNKPLNRRKSYGPSAYEFVEEFNEDQGSQVKIMQNKKTGERVLVKYYKASRLKTFDREVLNHKRLLHENIVLFYEVFADEQDCLAIVTELPDGGLLSERIYEHGPVTESQAKSLYLDLLAGMSYCHEKKIYHRDLKPETLFLHMSKGVARLKIAGFGYSKGAMFDSVCKTTGARDSSNPLNIPPELITGSYGGRAGFDGTKLDVWQSAVVLYFMLTGTRAFEDPNRPGALTTVASKKIIGCELSFPEDLDISQDCKNFLLSIFMRDPDCRPPIWALKEMPWLAGTQSSVDGIVELESQQTGDEISQIVNSIQQRQKHNRHG